MQDAARVASRLTLRSSRPRAVRWLGGRAAFLGASSRGVTPAADRFLRLHAAARRPSRRSAAGM
jgi:hypothetical protein